MLVDATAMLGAASKSRTSAPTLARDMDRVAALTLAGDLDVSYVYVASEWNPADDPSGNRPHQEGARVGPAGLGPWRGGLSP